MGSRVGPAVTRTRTRRVCPPGGGMQAATHRLGVKRSIGTNLPGKILVGPWCLAYALAQAVMKTLKAIRCPIANLSMTTLALSGFMVSGVRAVESGTDPIHLLPMRDGGFGGWRAEGDAFSKGPATDGWLEKLEIENPGNAPVASSEMDGDLPTGRLVSPEFRIERPFIAFRIGGGDDETNTCLNLLVDGKVVRSACGWRSDRLAPASWNVGRWKGLTARLELVDRSTGDWGHINVADIEQTGSPARPPLETGPLYQECLRPQFHFTARQWTMNRLNPGQRQEGWINDLNGLIQIDGEYHLFAQRWARCWVHAVSRDLVHWTELEPAFWEESPGSGVQSGTCVWDRDNTSGLSPDPGKPPLVAFWSRFDNRSQCVCYSLDKGRTWQRYAKNPIMDRPERDPKVFWHAPTKRWVMWLYGNGQYHILTSSNLLEWTDENHPLPDCFECPDFFELPVDGDPAIKKWVMVQGSGRYSIGSFDGKRFTEETPRIAVDVGPNFYATQSWENTDPGDGRRIQVAWMRGADFADMPFNQMISFPCELTLRKTPGGPRLCRKPAREIAALHLAPDLWQARTLEAGRTLPMEPSGQLFHIQAELEIPSGASLAFSLRGVPVVCRDRAIEMHGAKIPLDEPLRKLEMLIDRTSLEVFVNGGVVSSTQFVLPRGNGLSAKAEGGPVRIGALLIHPLASAWPDAAAVER